LKQLAVKAKEVIGETAMVP